MLVHGIMIEDLQKKFWFNNSNTIPSQKSHYVHHDFFLSHYQFICGLHVEAEVVGELKLVGTKAAEQSNIAVAGELERKVF